MSDIYKGELQDYEGNTIYPHSEADVIFCTDGETAQSKLNKYEEALGDVTGVTDSLEVDDSKILVSAKALHKVNSSLGDGRVQLVVNNDGSLGYKLDGADTVYPFKNVSKIQVKTRLLTSSYSWRDWYVDLYVNNKLIKSYYKSIYRAATIESSAEGETISAIVNPGTMISHTL